MCVFGLRPRFFFGIGKTVSMSAPVNAVIASVMWPSSSSSDADDDDMFVEARDDGGMDGLAVVVTFHTVGDRKVQPPSS